MNPAELNLNPLSQLDPVVILAVAVIVLVTYVLLRRVYVLPYLEVMEAREEVFATARRQSAEASGISRDSELEAERLLAEAAATAEEIRNEADARADAYRKQRLAKTSQRASESIETGRKELRELREREMATVRGQAIECVAAACAHLLGTVDTEAVESTVVRLMERTTH